MIAKAWRATLKFLRSALLATVLLAFVGVWSMVATLIPQDIAADKLAAWLPSHAVIEPFVRMIGLHSAFTAPVFLAACVLLGVSTGLCAWERTKVALHRWARLRAAAGTDAVTLAAKPDLSITVGGSLSASEALLVAEKTLDDLGVKTKRRGDVIGSVSQPWAAWGSPIFHWALFALIVAFLLGALTRSEGFMAVPVGQTKVDKPSSYFYLAAGPLHNWAAVKRSIRVDSFIPDYFYGGIDRGPTPTVTVLDGAGHAIATQRVYPNMMLKDGPLAIHAADCGLAATFAILDPSRSEVARTTLPIDFLQTAPDGTVPLGRLFLTNGQQIVMYYSATVPLDRVKGGQFGEWIPKDPRAHLLVTGGDGTTKIVDAVLRPGQGVGLPNGASLRLISVGWYARLSVVDDWTVWLIYAAFALAMLGMTIASAMRQEIVLATIAETPDGLKLVGSLRLWRGVPTDRPEIERELARTLGAEAPEDPDAA